MSRLIYVPPTTSTLFVADLREKLSEKGLSTNGNKNELVARLTSSEEGKFEATNEGSNKNAATDLGDLAPPEDDIDWGDMDNDAAVEESSKPSEEAPKTEGEPAKVESNEEQQKVEPATSEPSEKPENTTEESTTKDSQDSQDSEILLAEQAKLVERAKRFGLPIDDDKIKKAARANRFGVQTAPLAEQKNEEQDRSHKGRLDKRGKQKFRQQHQNQQAGQKRKGSILEDPVEAEKAKKRAERFSTPAKN
ncbi:RNA binding protein [Schizosaccharomyces cryophilus OY26]|uniref:RNA binding protein n=1 Tax=Schizosaccharomyces cryophilus (strain OY26 / ATCC MYA-4695 / CBS 11777 / NBRC 106824 / NRRL Y48691) TaxID=653667 RepID=S9X836_SCHCR|nr:RNA binding protein [Schizosaccharomyces cryophilus OY26]EPY49896.1 RNA binding protein [Schizosaccharomyces cryophilus OY26]